MGKEKIFVYSKRGQKKGKLILEGERFGLVWVLWAFGEGRLIPEKTTEIPSGSPFKDHLKRLKKYYLVNEYII